jgi:hypothetical protein
MKSAERTIDPKELMSTMEQGEDVVLIDVRPKDDYSSDPKMIPNAAWRDPNLGTQWSEELPKDKKVIGGTSVKYGRPHIFQLRARKRQFFARALSYFRHKTVWLFHLPCGEWHCRYQIVSWVPSV